MTPLGFMLWVMNNPGEDPNRRDRMAQAAVRYVARLAQKKADSNA